VGRVSEMGSLASSLAHELNQPLTAIANYCEAARDLLPADRVDESLALVREALDEAAKETIRAGQIVQRLREFVRPGEADRRVESLARLVTEANALALVGTREHGIEVQVQLDPAADDVFVDRIQIQQVLTNLVRNAIDAMLDSPIRSLIIRSEASPDDLVTLTIEDTGSGIDPEIAPQLFQPFVSSKQNGMGVGLSICRTIVEAQGGRIWFEPRPGGGTAFHFTLPLGGAVE
jgi:two-component system sensor kinase FixL